MAEQPSAFPRWADEPPVAPPTTIVEPSDPEKDEGFQPGVQAQRVDITFAGNADGTYQIVLNGVASAFVASGDTLSDIIDGLVADIIADGEPVTPTNQGGTTLRLVADIAGVAFTYDANSSGGASAMTATLIDANRSNKPIRQFLNWLFNLIYLWLAWLDQSVFRSSDLHPDQALPLGNLPGNGAGLGPIAAGDFSGAVYVNGYRVKETDSPQHTYADDSDTYWDLSDTGEWNYVVVDTSDPEPAVTADSVRVYMVPTVAGARNAFVDFRRRLVGVGVHEVVQNQRLTTESMAIGEASTGTEMRAPRQTFELDGAAGITYQLCTLWDMNDSLGDARLYTRLDGAGTSVGFSLVWGARITTGTTWNPDIADCYRLDFQPTGSTVGMRFSARTGLTPNITFADSDWTTSGSDTRLQLPLGFGLRLGGDAIGAGVGFESVRVPLIEWIRNAGGAVRTLLTEDRSASSQNISEYISTESGNAIYERVYNATCLSGSWSRTRPGDSFLLTMANNGFAIYSHDASAGNPWTTAGWDLEFFVGDGGATLTGSLTMDGVLIVNDSITCENLHVTSNAEIDGDLDLTDDLDVGGDAVVDGNLTVGLVATVLGSAVVNGHITVSETNDTPVANSIYLNAISKACGRVLCAAGNINSGASGYGYTAAISGTDLIVTLLNAVTVPIVTTGIAVPSAAEMMKYAVDSSTQLRFTAFDDNGAQLNFSANTIGLAFDVKGV